MNSRSRTMLTWLLSSGVAGGVLVAASFLKVYQLAVNPLYHLEFVDSRWVTLAIAEGELTLGLWLLSRTESRWSKWVGGVCYLIFAAINLGQVIQGRAACGCFGAIEIDPVHMMAFDIYAAASLLIFAPVATWTAAAPNLLPLVSVCVLFGGMEMTAFVAANRSFASTADGGSTSKIVVLTPQEWVGKPVPILNQIQQMNGSHWDLSNAIIVLYNPTCHDCMAFLEKLRHYAATGFGPREAQVILVEVPSGSSEPTSEQMPIEDQAFAHGILPVTTDWFVQTPVAIRVHRGLAKEITQNPERVVEWFSGDSLD